MLGEFRARTSKRGQDQRAHRQFVDQLSLDEEVEELHPSQQWGADAVMDLSTGKQIDEARQAILDAATVPIGTVSIYQIFGDRGVGTSPLCQNQVLRLGVRARGRTIG